jgi:hypothetical protein
MREVGTSLVHVSEQREVHTLADEEAEDQKVDWTKVLGLVHNDVTESVGQTDSSDHEPCECHDGVIAGVTSCVLMVLPGSKEPDDVLVCVRSGADFVSGLEQVIDEGDGRAGTGVALERLENDPSQWVGGG